MKTHLSENVRFVEYESEVLKGNPLGDPYLRRFPVYVPPDYESLSDKRYPVIFGLTGFTGSGVSYLNRRFLFQAQDEILDDLILNQAMPGVIYVFPDCLTVLGGSQYVNSTAVGRYEDYIVDELVPFIDTEFRTTGRRGCVGGSSGGIGSFWLAARHPAVFQAFADHSGDSAFEYCYLSEVPAFVQAIAKYDYTVEEFVRRIPDVQPKDEEFNTILNLVAMASCYSPNPDAPLGFEMPFDVYSGELKPDIWEKWRVFDPVNLVEPLQENLRRMRLIFIDCGTKDQFRLFLGSRQVHGKLEQFGIDHVYEEYDSDHFLLRREQERKSIPMVVRALTE